MILRVNRYTGRLAYLRSRRLSSTRCSADREMTEDYSTFLSLILITERETTVKSEELGEESGLFASRFQIVDHIRERFRVDQK